MNVKQVLVTALAGFFGLAALLKVFAAWPETDTSPLRMALQQSFAAVLILGGALAGGLIGVLSGYLAGQLYRLPRGSRQTDVAWILSLLGFAPLFVAYVIENQAFGPFLIESPEATALSRALYPLAIAFDPALLLAFASTHLVATSSKYPNRGYG